MDDDQRTAVEELRVIRRMMERTAVRWTGESWSYWSSGESEESALH